MSELKEKYKKSLIEKQYSRTEVIKLIRMYQENPCLWDLNSSTYNQSPLKDKALSCIAVEFGVSTNEIKRKIKSLRATYVSAKKKYETSKLECPRADDVEAPGLFWFKEMEFLDSTIVFRKGYESENRQSTEPEMETNETEFPDIKCDVLSEYSENAYESNPVPSDKRIKSQSPNYDDMDNSMMYDEEDDDLKFKTPQDDVRYDNQNEPYQTDTLFESFGRTVVLQLKELFKLDKLSAYEVMQEQHLMMTNKMIEVLSRRRRHKLENEIQIDQAEPKEDIQVNTNERLEEDNSDENVKKSERVSKSNTSETTNRFKRMVGFDTMRFLEHYRNHACLWDKSVSDYRNRQKRGQAEIALMNVTGFTDRRLLRTKIRSIRGTYNNELRRIRNSKQSTTDEKDVYYPKLHWFSFANEFLHKNFEDDNESECFGNDSNDYEYNWKLKANDA